MKKIVVNKSYDKFSVSHLAFLRLRELGQPDALKETDLGAYWPESATPREPSLNQCGILIPRDDLKLAQVVEELGVAANGHGAELRVVTIPDDVRWEISAVGGIEHVSEVHRTWK
ncbi:MAG: hypothetical protein ITD36_08720 [Nitrospira sp.]|nr:hypothetical protein [Nitrospira sp.]MDW7654247.1 hypothetical protein [Nitrospiraceae bacterium]GBL40572.1 hypothetical protein EMGBD2_18300 [Nitrospirota bacterium]MBP0121352.1 hypothetical protein [Nitrospira sp.]MBP0123554.1 hypothetical protein [Nitrospira sp.]